LTAAAGEFISDFLDVSAPPRSNAMTTVLEEPRTEPAAGTSPAARLRATMAAVKLSFTWFGTRKTLTREQKAQAADAFGAAGEFLSAGKKLLDTQHAAFKAVTAVRGRAQSFCRSITLPFPEPGLRLIRQRDIAAFDVQLTTLRAELTEAVEQLDRHYSELRTAARRRLGSLYNPADYPSSLEGLFAIAWEYPSVEPPSYLRQLNPVLFEQEQARVAARFEEAVRLAEESFLGELGKLIAHLSEQLSGQEDGKPKVFRDTAVTNLREFFERFRQLNIRSNEELDQLVEQAQGIVQGVAPQDLRENVPLREQIASQLAGVQSVLDGLLVERPRRAILRRPR
jgi:hypothetical protein